MCCDFFFFFQAEDGIRDGTVTGVQTCALPIWMEAHDVKIGAVNDAGANFPGLPEADHSETDGGELAEGAEGFDACTQVLNFRHGEWDFPGADTGRALLDVNEALLIAVDERPKQHTANQAEDGGVGANA